MSAHRSKLFTGGICIEDLLAAKDKGHSAFYTDKNTGKLCASILLWENPEPYTNGNTHSIQLNSVKDLKDVEKKIYFGWAKPVQSKKTPPETGQTYSVKNNIDENEKW